MDGSGSSSSSSSSGGGSPPASTPSGPPYAPTNALLGGVPTVGLDVPVTAVFLALFLVGAVSHMTIFQLNRRRSHKFLFSGLLFGFCMARITTCVMRLVWATRPTDIRVGIAAQIFTAAGVVLLFVVDLFFAHRLLRATHPRLGWHRALGLLFVAYYASIVAVLIALITAVVQSFYTRDPAVLRACTDITRFGSVYFAVAAFLPLLLVLVGIVIPRHAALDRFGWGSFRVRLVLLVFAATILTLGAAFRAGTGFLPRPQSNPAWYHSKACFYVFNFTIEIIIVLLYAVMRVDLRFHVPDGANRATGYQGRTEELAAARTNGARPKVLTEEELLDADPLDKQDAAVDQEKASVPSGKETAV